MPDQKTFLTYCNKLLCFQKGLCVENSFEVLPWPNELSIQIFKNFKVVNRRSFLPCMYNNLNASVKNCRRCIWVNPSPESQHLLVITVHITKLTRAISTRDKTNITTPRAAYDHCKYMSSRIWLSQLSIPRRERGRIIYIYIN